MHNVKKAAGLLLAGGVFAIAPASFGQAVYGSIFGTVVDASGASIPGATVVVTDAAKGTSQTYTTNSSGEFTADHLIPDAYNVKITFAGFKAFETQNLAVSADTSRKLEAALQLGGTDQVVEVNASDIAQLKVDRADVSTNFDSRQIEDLPIGDRNFTNLQLLLPGAQQLGWSHAASENPQGSKQIQVDGQAFGGVAFELDGTDNQDPILGIIVINPNIDSLQETKITTQNFDAEFGKAVSSVVTAQTKSGGNSFHGSGFDYYQNDSLHARDPFTQSAAQGIAPSTRNQFGGSLGGRIIKDKLFFFGDYQGVRQSVGTSILQTVPTAQVISTCLGTTLVNGVAGCDFSQYLNAKNRTGSTVMQIYNAQGVAYTNNFIPIAQVSPQAQALFKLLQPFAPNTSQGSVIGADGLSLNNNYAASGSGTFNSDQYDVRVDYQPTEKLHTFGRYSRFTDVLSGTTAFGAAGGAGFGLNNYGGNSQGHNTSVALGADYVFTPSLVADLRLGYYRYNINNSKYDQGVNFATQLGIPGENIAGNAFTSGAPLFNISEVGNTNEASPNNGNSSGPQYGGGLNVTRCNCPLKENEDQFQIVENLTKTIGTHAIKFGSDLRYARNLRVPSDNDRTGINNFNSQYTGDGKGNGGLGFATFALGEVTTFNRYVSTSTNAKEFQKRDFFYAQDTWRATQRLTVNYGLRYELYFPESINTTGQGAVLNLNTGYLQVAGVGGVGSNMNFSPTYNGYNPRIGVAYQVTDKTVIRAGYGRSFDIGVFGSLFGHVATQNLPVLANQAIVNTGGPKTGAFSLATGPAAPTPVTVPANGLLASPGYAVTSKARPTTVRLPTIDAWNLSLQQSLSPSLSFTIAYVANKGTHTLSAGDGNSTNPNEAAIVLPAQYSVTGNALHFDPDVAATDRSGIPATVGSNITGISANGGTNNQTYLKRYFAGKLAACSDPTYLAQPGAAAAVAGLPNGACGWTNDVTFYGDDQDTHYNALQATLTKQFNRHYSINANYAWQQSINFNNSFATYSRAAVRGRDESTREQQFIAYGLLNLPFGKNEHFFGNSNAILQTIVGGFQLSPVLTYGSGLPFTINLGTCRYLPNSAPCYVNGNANQFTKKTTGFAGGTMADQLTFYPVQGGNFQAPGLDQIGSVGRDSVFGPHFFNMDLAATKNFTFRERYTAQFRLDAYNVFNHINFGNPGSNITQPGTIGGQPGGATARYLQLSGRFQF